MIRRKLYYVPGMISLIILPLILLSYSSQWRQKEDWRVVEVNYNDDKPPHRNYLDLRLTGDPSLDKTIIDYSRLRIQEILSSKDTLNGIHFVFGKQVKYSSFVKIFNNMLLDEKPYYTNSGNEMWVFDIKEVSASAAEYRRPFGCGTSMARVALMDYTPLPYANDFKTSEVSVTIISAWCLLIFVPILKHQKFLKANRLRI